MCTCSTGYYGYVPTVGKAAIRITITSLHAERVHHVISVLNQSFEGIPAYSDYRYYGIQVNIVHLRPDTPWRNVTRRRKEEI